MTIYLAINDTSIGDSITAAANLLAMRQNEAIEKCLLTGEPYSDQHLEIVRVGQKVAVLRKLLKSITWFHLPEDREPPPAMRIGADYFGVLRNDG